MIPEPKWINVVGKRAPPQGPNVGLSYAEKAELEKNARAAVKGRRAKTLKPTTEEEQLAIDIAEARTSLEDRGLVVATKYKAAVLKSLGLETVRERTKLRKGLGPAEGASEWWAPAWAVMLLDQPVGADRAAWLSFIGGLGRDEEQRIVIETTWRLGGGREVLKAAVAAWEASFRR